MRRPIRIAAGLAGLVLFAACVPVRPPPPPPSPMSLGWQDPGITKPIVYDATNNLLWAVGNGDLNAVDPSNGTVVHQHALSLDGSQHFPTPTVTQNWVLVESSNHLVAFSNPTMSVSWTSPALDGMVQGRPVVVGDIVVVATENDSLYGLNLADGTLNTSSWTTNPVNFGPPETASHIRSFPSLNACGNVFPLGITGHPVLDPGTGWVYAVGDVQTGTASGADPPVFKVIAVDPATGTVKVGPTGIDPTGMNTPAEQQRAGLLVAGGKIYVGFGGLAGDCGSYHGWVVAVNDGDGSVAGNLELTSNSNAGAVWGTGGGAVDGSDDVYVSSGNGEGSPNPGTDYSDAVVRVPSPSGGVTPTTVPADYFQPAEWRSDNNADADLGAAAPVIAPNGTQLFIIGKQHNAFLLNLSSLGGSDHLTPAARLDGACTGGVFGQNAVVASTNSAYIACSDGMRQVHLP